MKKSWSYKTTWNFEEVPEYWRSIWGDMAFNCHSLRRQWTVLDAAKYLRLKRMDQIAGSFSSIV